MRVLRLVLRGLPLIALAVAAIVVLILAQRTEDQDARVCQARGGEVIVDTYPHSRQPAVHRCVKDGRTVAAWKRVDGRNVLIIKWSVDW